MTKGTGGTGGVIVTGKPPGGDALSLQRRLLSEYRPDLTLERYVSYSELKGTIKEIEQKTKKVTAEITAQWRKEHGEEKEPDFREVATALEAQPELQALHERFFDLMWKSFKKVSTYLAEADKAAIIAVGKLKNMSEADVKEAGVPYLVSIYSDLQELTEYREMNSAMFGKALRKYSDRCAFNSLLALRRVRFCDDNLSASGLCTAPFDVTEKIDWIISVYGIVFGVNFEEGTRKMRELRYRQHIALRDRLLPMGKSYYYQRHTATLRPKQGSFARKIMAGTTSKHLAKYASQLLCAEPLKANLGTFANGEVSVSVAEAVRGDDVFVIQSLTKTETKSLSTMIMELCLVFQTLKLAAAKRSTAVLPYLGYTGSHTPEISALAEMICAMGCDHVITVDMFNEQAEGFFHVPVENISASFEFTGYLLHQLAREGHTFEDIVVVAPDSHTVNRARAFADALMRHGKFVPKQFVQVATAVRRTAQTSVSHKTINIDAVSPNCRDFIHEIDITGDVEGKLCLIVDCVLDEGVNLHTIAEMLKLMGASRIKAVVTHALFSGDAENRMVEAPIEELIVSDSIQQDARLANPELAKKLRVLPLAPLIADAVERVHTENTLSTIFDVGRKK